jgi:hypothetical protein
MSRLVLSCSTKFFKIKVNLAEKIQGKVYANQDKSLSDLKIVATLMISIVFCSLIIHEFDNVNIPEYLYFPMTHNAFLFKQRRKR